MFRNKKDSELDYTSLNEILKIGDDVILVNIKE